MNIQLIYTTGNNIPYYTIIPLVYAIPISITLTIDNQSKKPTRQFLSTKEHAHVVNGHYLKIMSPDMKSGIVFENNEKGIVSRYRSGKANEVQWAEGCL